MSGFSTLNTAVSGLNAQQRALSTIAQNVANVNSIGYSRQRVDMSAVGAPVGATFHTGRNALFGGVNVDGVTRIRDAFLEGTRAAAGGRMAALNAQVATLRTAEQLLGEPGDTGLQATLDSFYTAWQDLAQRPTDSAAGSVVIQRGVAVATQLNSVSGNLADTWTTSRDNLSMVITQANQAASDLASINEKIRQGVNAGLSVNELTDQRDTLVRTLAELVGGVASPGSDGTVSVSVGGITVVGGARAETLTLGGAGTVANATDDPPVIMWGGTVVPIESGTAAGLLSVTAHDLPEMFERINEVAIALRDSVNAVHTEGFTLDGDAGGDFFVGDDAMTLALAVSLPSELAVAAGPGTVDGSNALKLGDLVDEAKSADVLGSAGPAQLWRELATGLGVRVQSLESAQSVQANVLATADAAVESDAGVSIDEEMTNMLLYQRAYQASSRVITTVDEMLDTLINRTGVVGR